MESEQTDSRSADREQYINLAATRWARRQAIAGVDERGRALNPTIGQRILIELAFTADSSGISKLGQAALARACLCGDRVVRAWLRVFEASGLIARSKRSLKTGGRTSDSIQLKLDAAVVLPLDCDLWAERKRRPAPVKVPSNEESLIGQIAPGAGSTPPQQRPAPVPKRRPAPGQTAPRAAFLIQKINNLPYPPLAMETEMAIRDELTNLGVSPETAEAIMQAFATTGAPLNTENIPNLVRKNDGLDLEQQARKLFEDGLGRAMPDGQRRGQRPAAAQTKPPTRRVNATLTPDLWQRCCNASGHKPSMTGQDGGWGFDAELVARFAAEG